MVKNPPANAGDIRDMDSISGSGRSPGGVPGASVRNSAHGKVHEEGGLAYAKA